MRTGLVRIGCMSTDRYVYMPSAGPVTAITLVRWIVPDGAPVQKSQPICELETDKATLELLAPEGGILRHIVSAQSVCAPGALIARIIPNTKQELAPD